MEEPPLVPQKDARYSKRMAADLSTVGVASSSKRKRHADESNGYDVYHSDLDAADLTDHTPKRSRATLQQGEASASEDNNAAQPRLVRKKGSRNLSTLNLRHAARTQTLTQAQARDSKFQEGSLTDKPSDKPPSFFTRMTRADRGNPAHVDALMEDYHNGTTEARQSIEHDRDASPRDAMETAAGASKKDEGKGFFQFGRQLAASFRPVALWKTIWAQSKEEIIKEDKERAAALREKQKAEAEAKYAEMKEAGEFGLQLVEPTVNGVHRSMEEASTPHDSGFAFDSLQSSLEQSRSTSAATQLIHPVDDLADGEENNTQSTTSAVSRGLKALQMKKPSLANIPNGLKRMRSDMSITGNRESSSSMSPVKADFTLPMLKKSTSKFELKTSGSKVDLKKQHKLSKRVSDLEHKLQLARKELDEALEEASPMPKLTGKHERFTLSSSIARPKFLPGKLPSLPSERILMAEQGGDVDQSGEVVMTDAQIQPRKGNELSLDDYLAERESEEEEETIRASRARPYPTRATSLFNLRDKSNFSHQHPTKGEQEDGNTHLHRAKSTEGTENMDPNSVGELTSDAAATPAKPVDYGTLDAKLKALDANVKTARRAAKPKKRKSAVADEDKTFKPAGAESDDDFEFEETPRKKQRKGAKGKNESSPQNKRPGSSGSQRSPPKNGKGAGAKMNGVSAAPEGDGIVEESAVEPSQVKDDGQEGPLSADERADEEEVRTSMDSQATPLDPVYEEEEDTVAGASNAKTAATSTQGNRNTIRSRPSTPSMQRPSAEGVAEEATMMMRAARAAQQHPSRQHGGRSASPPPPTSPNGVTKTTFTEETITVVPGEGDVPFLPKGARGSFESVEVREEVEAGDEVSILRAGAGTGEKDGEAFQWPDDVF